MPVATSQTLSREHSPLCKNSSRQPLSGCQARLNHARFDYRPRTTERENAMIDDPWFARSGLSVILIEFCSEYSLTEWSLRNHHAATDYPWKFFLCIYISRFKFTFRQSYAESYQPSVI